MKKRALILAFWIGSSLLCGGEYRDVYLKAPDLSDSAIIGYKVGVRPYRKSGIRIEKESMGSKTIIHNYGYGGSGITLCFGGALEVLDLLRGEPDKKVAILGAGVIGLAVAYELLDQGYDVCIYANEFSPHLTSDVGAGVWSPPVPKEDASIAQKEMLQRMIKTSEERIQKSLDHPNPEFTSVFWMKNYNLNERKSELPKVSKVFLPIGKDREVVQIHFDNGVVQLGVEKIEFHIDGKIFMRELYSHVLEKGAHVIRRHFSTKEEIESLEENLVINCTSFGSRELFGDEEFVPIRGHLIQLKPQEGVDCFFYNTDFKEAGYWTMVFPRSDEILLGGVFECGEEECVVNQEVVQKILSYARESFGEKK